MARLIKAVAYILGGALTVVLLLLTGLRLQSLRRERLDPKTAAPPDGVFVPAGDLELFAQQAGPSEGPVVVFIHGTGAWSEIWRKSMEAAAARGFRAVALDLPPFGFSQAPASAADFAVARQGRRVVAALDALGIKEAILVGHSFGARATVEAALALDDRLRGLVLVDGALGLNAKEAPTPLAIRAAVAWGPLRNALVAAVVTNPAFSRRLLSMLIWRKDRATPEVMRMIQAPMPVKGTTEKTGLWLKSFLAGPQRWTGSQASAYAGLRCPVLLVWGEKDAITLLPQGEALAKIIPGSSLTVMPDTGHIPTIEDPEGFSRILAAFLESLKKKG